MTATDLIAPNPKQLHQLNLAILAVCSGYYAIGKCLRSAQEEIIKAGCPLDAILRTGVSYFAIPADTKWDGPLRMQYPDNAGFRLTKLGTL